MKGNEMKYFYLSGNDISACIVSLMITRMITIQSQFEGWSQTVRWMSTETITVQLQAWFYMYSNNSGEPG